MVKGRLGKDGSAASRVLGALDDMEQDLHHLEGLITTFQILGEAGDSIEPVAVSSLARCARETLEELEQNWQVAIGALQQR